MSLAPRTSMAARFAAAALAAAVFAAALATPTRAEAEGVPSSLVVLSAQPGPPGSELQGMPPRFVLLKDGQVFVGGTADLERGRLEKDELKALQKRIEAVRKAVGRSLRIGDDTTRSTRLLLLSGDAPIEISIAGDPTSARPVAVANLVGELLRFEHPSLARHSPQSFAVSAREERLAGGCRNWSFPVPLAQALAAPIEIPAADAAGWPSGGWPASVCDGEKRYVVTLRPLLPGETP